MLECGKMLWQRNLIGACEGNLSCRLDENRLLCTRSGVSKGHLTLDDLVEIHLDGKQIDPNSHKPSSEIRVHLAIYRECPHVEAVVHAHPIFATAFALSGVRIPTENMPEALVELGPVALVPFGMPGTDDLPDALKPFIPGHCSFLLANHGAVTTGRSLLEASHRMETFERVAQIVFLSNGLGGPALLPAGVFDRLKGPV
jgi:L-fuculose-phosphate aldolase